MDITLKASVSGTAGTVSTNTGPSPTPWTRDTIPNILVRWDANKLDGATTGTVADGANVTSWTPTINNLGTAFSAAPTVPGTPPTFKASALNGKPGIQFSNTVNKGLKVIIPVIIPTPFIIAVVCTGDPNLTPDAYQNIIAGTPESVATTLALYRRRNSSGGGMFVTAQGGLGLQINDLNPTVASVQQGTLYLIEFGGLVTFTGTSSYSTSCFNETPGSSASSPGGWGALPYFGPAGLGPWLSGATATPGTFYIGATNTGVGLAGTIQEVTIFQDGFNAKDYVNIETALRTYYGF